MLISHINTIRFPRHNIRQVYFWTRYTCYVVFRKSIVFFYFFLIRPQRKREKAQAALMAALNKGDEVVTQAGLVGVIAKVEDDFVQVKVGPTTLRFQKAAVIGTLPKGTLKQLDAEGG